MLHATCTEVTLRNVPTTEFAHARTEKKQKLKVKSGGSRNVFFFIPISAFTLIFIE